MTEAHDDRRLPARTNAPYDAPEAPELIGAVRDYLQDLMGRSTGADRWLLRVAANALTIAQREVANGPTDTQAHQARLEALGVSSDHELSAAIRAGDFDDRWDEVATAVRASVAASLAVANPNHAADRA